MHQVGFDDLGKIGSLKAEMYCDTGYAPNDVTTYFGFLHMQSAYKAIGWEVKPGWVTTNTPANTACRAPGKNTLRVTHGILNSLNGKA